MNGYYRLREEYPDAGGDHGWGDYVGTLFYIYKGIGDDDYKLLQGDNHWLVSEDVLSYFDPAPEGLSERQKEIANLMEATEIDQLRVAEQHQILLGAGESGEPQDPSEHGLVPKDQISLDRINAKLIDAKTQFTKMRELMTEKRNQLSAFLSEQKAILAAKSAELEQQIKVASQAMSVLQTYSGVEDELTIIHRGEPAPMDTPLTLRQMILFADEELAVAHEETIDFEKIHLFDEWVKKPKNRDLIIPEKKCVVAIKPRRTKLDYGDPWINMQKTPENFRVYILIRNGDNLSRIFTTLGLTDVLFQRRDEFEEFFFERDSWTKEKKPLRPGSKAYMESMEKANQQQQEFMKVFILLQGLLDRTKVFEPTPAEGERINICNLSNLWWIQPVYDAELLLGDGRPDYDEWLEEANSKLEVGVRIVGNFCYGSYKFKRDERISPKSAHFGDDQSIYTIEKKDGAGYRFLFEYDKYYGEVAKKRASCIVYPDDDFIINIDAVEIEELEYYINSRIHRHHYMSMVPLMQQALTMKKKEVKEEAPFHLLVAGQIAKTFGVEVNEAQREVDELIRWWKFKNFTHRAIKKDDAKALRMIVEEYGRRQEIKNEPVDQHLQVLANSVAERDFLAAYLRSPKEYTVYRWMNDENIFVREESWRVVRGKLQLDKANDWAVVDKRHLSWRLLQGTERWNQWQKLVRPYKYLTDPEIQKGIEYAGFDLKKVTAITVAERSPQIYFFIAEKYQAAPKNRIYTESGSMPEYSKHWINWTKNRLGVKFEGGKHQHSHVSAGSKPWESDYWPGKLVYLNEERVRWYESELERQEAQKEARQIIATQVGWFRKQVDNRKKAAFIGEERIEFFKEYNDEEMWERHKNNKLKERMTRVNAGWLSTPIGMLLERGIEVAGKTMQQVVEEARKEGWGKTTKKYRRYRNEDDEDKYVQSDIENFGDTFFEPFVPPEGDEEYDD
jgi:hypothetical protein